MSIIGKFEKRIMYPLADFMHGTTITGHLAMLKQQQQLSHSEIVSIQDQKLSSLLNHSYEKVSYWRNLFDKCGLKPLDIKNANDLSRIAILNKSILRTKLSSLICKPPKGGKLKEQFSSGSTGEPVKYYTDNEAYSWRMAFMFLLWDWAGYEFGQKWCRISMWERNSIKDKLQDVLSRCLYISIAKFNQDVLEKYKLKIEKFRPAVIRGYAGALYLIADYLKKNNVNYDFVKTVITTGDMLYPHYRKTIETVFNTKVFDNYGGEGIMVSGQCEYGNYHINDTNLIIEIVDRDNNPVQKGWMGRILLTDLTNYSMPFIRYDIGDLGQLKAGTCECGRGLSLMKQPKGRDTDIIYLSNGNYLIVHFFTALFEFYSEVKQFQVIETDFDKLQLNLVVTEDFNCQLLKEIKFKITESAGMHIDIWENIVDEIPATSSGKRRFVIAKKRNG